MRDIMSKRIVIFDGTLKQGGAERVISILSRYMHDDGYKVEILLYHDAELFYDIHPEVKIISVEHESGTKNVIKNLLWMRKFFKQNADIVLSFLAPFNILALVAHMGLKSTIVVADRNDPRFIPGNKVVRLVRDVLYNFADGVVLQTSRNKAYFNKAIQAKSTVIFNPIDLGEKAGLALRTTKKKKIVSVGRLMPQKNQRMLFDAFAAICDQYPDYELYVYGEGPEQDNLNQYAKELGIGERVHLPGSVKNVFEQIVDAELFVLSSDFEGMPNALIEAMCVGLPCITTRVSGAEDLVQEGINGCIVDVGSTEQLIEKMKEFLSDPQKRQMCSEKATELNDQLATNGIMNEWIEYLGGLE